MEQSQKPITFTIFGEPASKANSRRIAINRKTGLPMVIKSAKAIDYASAFKMQCPKLPQLMVGDLSVSIDIYYASRRPDLDESVCLDAMQGAIYSNDRQVKEKHIRWRIDPANPRAHITVAPLVG